jgi:hypothetical protein
LDKDHENEQRIVTIWIALMIGSAFATSALAVGSDVVRYPTAGAYSSAAMKAKEHYDIGVPAPRLRIFVKAPWTDATRRTPF